MIENTLILACMNGDIDAVSILLENGADVNAIDNGFTALMMVSNCDADFINLRYYQLESEIKNRIKIIKLLCEYGANINATDDDGNTALDFAEISNFQDIWNDIIITLKQCAIEQKNDDIYSHLYNGVEIKNNTFLMWVSAKGYTNDVKSLLDNGADVSARNNFGWTPLICGCYYGHTEVVRLLLDNGADVNARNNDGQTALMIVSNCDANFINLRYYQLEYEILNRQEIIKLLCNHGADINAIDNDGDTALDLAEKFNFQDIWNDIIITLKQCAIEQIIPKFKKRQKDQTKLGWMLREKKVKNRGMRFPYDLEHYIRGFIG